MSCICGGDIIYDEGRAENVPINYNDTLLQLFYKLIILLKFLEFCCIIKRRWGFQRSARLLNGVYTGGYATLRREVVTMIKYILRVLFFTIVFLIVFTIKVK